MDSQSYLQRLIKYVWSHRQRVWPADIDEGIDWAITEIGEVKELTLARRGVERGVQWVRNNPGDHPPYSKERLAKELCDVMMMVQIAGMSEGIDVIHELRKRLRNKVEEYINQH